MYAFQDYWETYGKKWANIADELQEATGYAVWNPGIYGAAWHAARISVYEPAPGSLLGIGLNPGPYGMSQTGIPFTDIKRMCEYLPTLCTRLAGPIEVPGLAPESLQPYLRLRHEASAMRVYLFLSMAFGSAEVALTQFAFANPCSLLFIERETCKNRTPADFLTRIHHVHPEWSDTRVKGLLARVNDLRLESALAGVEAIDARAVILLGKDVQSAIGDQLSSTLGKQRVVSYPHPARAVPNTWSRELIDELRLRRFL